jgi:hypothetical protein
MMDSWKETRCFCRASFNYCTVRWAGGACRIKAAMGEGSEVGVRLLDARGEETGW